MKKPRNRMEAPRFFLSHLFAIILTVIAVMGLPGGPSAWAYDQVPALVDLRTTYSDGMYDPETLVQMAVQKGFSVIFLNDHDQMVMEYGLPPLRNLIKKREERNAINKSGAEAYLAAIAGIRKKYPDVIVIPGTESAPFYYWTGSPLTGSLTANDHERRILTMGLEKAEDYKSLPVLHSPYGRIDLKAVVPALLAFGLSFLVSLFFLFKTGIWRLVGVVLALVNAGFFVNTLLVQPSPFDPYHGKQGMAPYQLFLDSVSQKGGLTFWNYPETRSGVRTLGPVQLKTLPYPEVLIETKNYTGFAALYGDTITITEPGNIWDISLNEYCHGFRERPPWGIATADFHKEGGAGQNLGDFQTVLLLAEKSQATVMAALRNGRMYACQGRYPQIPRLDEFTVSAAQPETAPRMISGGEILLERNPRIRITVSGPEGAQGDVEVRLIRSGTLIKTFKGKLPLSIDHTDILETPGEKVYYRMDMTGYGTIVSNPIFVTFAK
ncbi:MAG: hypothetical protein LLG93_01975 [Deltaproteobacteria bacterium]|nr:hypothetical protein [Deltaproteobacteria bacterium]